ncbi:hypothetical protein IQ07DRAFT_615243 [Pyrenochaeta sp. DS3sAY3a]|nr:hypothetical protein IQ07DRAFT_615243 [Pyrenochaeta sp. DS3sAY3a]
MQHHSLLLHHLLLTLLSPTHASPKSGLIHIPSSAHPSDDTIWLTGPSPPSWYYNYHATPSASYIGHSALHFVPMLWGAPETPGSFYASIAAQIHAGANITHVLAFNEPDGAFAEGGAQMSPRVAAASWKSDVEPLRKLGVRVGSPAVTGSERGWAWMEDWWVACAGGCRPDFVAVHWYGGFEGLMGRLGRVVARWEGREVWVTEWGWEGRGWEETRDFYGRSVRGMEGWANITRHAYFGAFRSDVSNIGPYAAMLTQDGELTDIGSWFLGGEATGNVPRVASSGTESCYMLVFR